MYSGQRLGKNAVENNYLLPQEKYNLVKELKDCNGNRSCEKKVQSKYEQISNPRDDEFITEYNNCKEDRDNCEQLNAIHYDLRMKLTQEGNEYYSSLSEEQRREEFILLPEKDSVFHSYQRDPSTDEVINVTTGREAGVQKFVHPIYGYEVVLDNNRNIVTDPLNIGTYNFYNPHLGRGNPLLEDGSGLYSKVTGNHKKFDVNPYILFGNSSDDPTTKWQRKTRAINYLK